MYAGNKILRSSINQTIPFHLTGSANFSIFILIGLIIISAQYGLSSSFTSRGIKESEKDEEEIIDVTIPIQSLVQDGKLYIPGGKGKFNIIGFWVSEMFYLSSPFRSGHKSEQVKGNILLIDITVLSPIGPLHR